MEKIILSGYDPSSSMPPLAHVKPGHTKIASDFRHVSKRTQDFLRNLKSEKGITYVLVNAMGAGEVYGPNVNGDYFPEDQLVNVSRTFLSTPVQDLSNIRREVGMLGYGYPTFYNACAFRHHKNKDPSKRLGTVVCADWNPRMKRVELVLRIDHARCKQFHSDDLLQEILSGQFPEVSMGCRVTYDVCSICGNKAKRKPDYCRHIVERRINKDPLGTGMLPYMINVQPKFFDISFVLVGADRTAMVLAKVASAENPIVRTMVHDLTEHYRAPLDDHTLKVAQQLYESGITPYDHDPYIEGKVKSALDRSPEFTAPSGYSFSNQKTASASILKISERLKKGEHVKDADIIKYDVPHPKYREVSRIEGGEEPLPEELPPLVERHGLGPVLRGLLKKRVILSPKQFTRMIVVIKKSPKLEPLCDEDLPRSTKVVIPFEPDSEDEIDIPAKIIGMMRSVMMTPHNVSLRSSILRKPGDDEDKGRSSSKEKKAFSENEIAGLLEKVATAYNGYRLWALANSSPLGDSPEEKLAESCLYHWNWDMFSTETNTSGTAWH